LGERKCCDEDILEKRGRALEREEENDRENKLVTVEDGRKRAQENGQNIA
jgi:hypothetical protein